MAGEYFVDRWSLAFGVFALALNCWAVFATRTFFRILSYNRKSTFTPCELMAIRVPGAIVIVGLVWMIAATLCNTR
ncbi:MAG TPA: hypothetical protein VFK13_08205 [Gemmatimonadaceae bacterium]|nr:hypothetical protein [Gemmatimonadaceae bacterium]